MKDKQRIPLELLAPAGNADMGMAAIDHGADAVYIGAPRFSARAGAGNSLEDIARLIDYAHLFRARVYLALNTIFTDGELTEARSIIDHVYQAGADGLIIQDMGLLELDLPPIPLIASTQTHNTTPEKVKFLEDVGFSRVILARELSLREIKGIRKKTTVELESFVHGALCVSYSGQCYLSQAAFGRSGNRGVCAQPCRLQYTLRDGNGKTVISNKYLLSLKDLRLIDDLKGLIDSGITSFKIEGRLKDLAYVKNVTAAYRQALDRLIENAPRYTAQSSGRVRFHFTPDLDKTFNRGYTRYFLHAPRDTGQQAAMDTPKSVGAKVGTVTRVDKKWFAMKGETLHNGDGMCFVSSKGELRGFRVNRVEHDRVYPTDTRGLSVGSVLFRNRDHEFMNLLDKKTAERFIGVTMSFDQSKAAIHLTVTDEDGNTVKATQPAAYETAKKPEMAKEQIRSQLIKAGRTIFRVTSFSMETMVPGFLPVRVLNSLRREALDALMELRKDTHAVMAGQRPPETVSPFPQATVDYHANVLNKHAGTFYEKHGTRVKENALEAGEKSSGRILMTTRYCIRREIGACLKNLKHTKQLPAPLTLDDGKRSYGLEFDCAHCRMHLRQMAHKQT